MLDQSADADEASSRAVSLAGLVLVGAWAFLTSCTVIAGSLIQVEAVDAALLHIQLTIAKERN